MSLSILALLKFVCGRVFPDTTTSNKFDLFPPCILLGTNDVPVRFIAFLDKYKVTTVHKFVSAAPNEEKVEKNLIEASGIVDLDFGETIAITRAWNSARAQMGGAGSASQPAAPKLANKMPEGIELILRGNCKAAHGCHLMGSWLVNEDTMTKIYAGLNDKEKILHVPDIAAMLRRSDLSQKPSKGTLITESGIEQV